MAMHEEGIPVAMCEVSKLYSCFVKVSFSVATLRDKSKGKITFKLGVIL